MPMHNGNEEHPGTHGGEEIDASQGFEQSDVRVTGIVVFLTALAIFVAVAGGLCYVMGKAINRAMDKQDGPDTKWAVSEDRSIRELGNLPTNPELQNKVLALTQRFPTPRVQTDDGNEDTAELHGREDLLLDNYTWVDRAKGTVRIPVERAMELIAERGLPVAAAAQHAAPMTADAEPQVTEPLTNGFARTAFEQEQARAEAAEEKRPQ